MSENETRLKRARLLMRKRQAEYSSALLLLKAAAIAVAEQAEDQLNRACDRLERAQFEQSFGSFDPVAMGC